MLYKVSSEFPTLKRGENHYKKELFSLSKRDTKEKPTLPDGARPTIYVAYYLIIMVFTVDPY